MGDPLTGHWSKVDTEDRLTHPQTPYVNFHISSFPRQYRKNSVFVFAFTLLFSFEDLYEHSHSKLAIFKSYYIFNYFYSKWTAVQNFSPLSFKAAQLIEDKHIENQFSMRRWPGKFTTILLIFIGIPNHILIEHSILAVANTVSKWKTF